MSGNASAMKWGRSKNLPPAKDKFMRFYMFGYRDVVLGNGYRKDYDRRYTEQQQRAYEWGRQWAQTVRSALNLGPTDDVPDWDPTLTFSDAMRPFRSSVGSDLYLMLFDQHNTWMKSSRVTDWLTV